MCVEGSSGAPQLFQKPGSVAGALELPQLPAAASGTWAPVPTVGVFPPPVPLPSVPFHHSLLRVSLSPFSAPPLCLSLLPPPFCLLSLPSFARPHFFLCVPHYSTTRCLTA